MNRLETSELFDLAHRYFRLYDEPLAWLLAVSAEALRWDDWHLAADCFSRFRRCRTFYGLASIVVEELWKHLWNCRPEDEYMVLTDDAEVATCGESR